MLPLRKTSFQRWLGTRQIMLLERRVPIQTWVSPGLFGLACRIKSDRTNPGPAVKESRSLEKEAQKCHPRERKPAKGDIDQETKTTHETKPTAIISDHGCLWGPALVHRHMPRT